jgi:lipopolysaccharide transport system ATP-binding protein
MQELAISARALAKEYVLGGAVDGSTTLYETLSRFIQHPLTALRRKPAPHFWALKDIDLAIRPGEIVGIIGRNGAGKSTLLKILSRITSPTTGRAEMRGRVASLLEVGTGFHPELTGRENIFLNGAILGMSREEIRRKFDDIVSFAELAEFVDTPVKRYSSGMYVRLAFAVAAHLDADILLVDEVLAVGDGAFQQRCLNKMEDVSHSGRTVLFVSHNLAAVARLCSRSVLLHRGRIEFDGNTQAAIAAYARVSLPSAEDAGFVHEGPLADRGRVLSVSLNGQGQSAGTAWPPGDELTLGATVRADTPLQQFRVTFCIHKGSQLVLSLHDTEQLADIPACTMESTVSVPAFFLSPGDYSVDVLMYSDAGSAGWLRAKGVLHFSVNTEWAKLYEPSNLMGVVNLPRAGSRRVVHAETAS